MKKSIVISIIFLILGISIGIYNAVDKFYKQKEEETKIISFFNSEINGIEPKELNKKNKYNYIAVLEIPSIDLKKGLVSKTDISNNVNENITILPESVMPDEEGYFILAAHSGTADISYFKNLNKLSLNDYIYVYYKNTKYIYKVNNFYEEEKGIITINNNSDKDKAIVLTTCKPITDDKQITYVAHLEGKSSY